MIKFSGFDFSIAEQREIVQTWLDGAIQVGTKDTDFAKSWNDWRYGWPRAEQPIGGALTTATAKAQEACGSIRERLMVFCRNLAGMDGKFFMSYGSAAEAAGCTKRGAYKVMSLLQREGFLTLLQCGEPRRGGLASEWQLL